MRPPLHEQWSVWHHCADECHWSLVWTSAFYSPCKAARRALSLMVSRVMGKRLGHMRGGAGARQKCVECVHPEDLRLEDRSEISGDGFGNSIEIELAAEFLMH